MLGIEVEFIIGKITGYKCRYCGEHLGVRHHDNKHSDTGIEEYSFCPYCGKELNNNLYLSYINKQ